MNDYVMRKHQNALGIDRRILFFPLLALCLLLTACQTRPRPSGDTANPADARNTASGPADIEAVPTGSAEEETAPTGEGGKWVVSKETICNSDGSAASWTEYEYDALGNKTKEARYNAGGALSGVTVYEYDDAGRMSGLVSSDENGTTELSISWTYDDDAGLAERRDRNSEGYLINWFAYAYDALGRKTVQNTLDPLSGEVFSREEYKYDADGNLTRRTVYASDGSVDKQTVSEYDNNGNETRHTESNAGIITKWVETEYGADGSILQTVTRNPDGSVMDTELWEYDASGLHTKTERRSADGTLMMWIEYDHDAEGRTVALRSFTADGSPLGYNVYEYNAEGLQTRFASCFPDGTVLREELQEYDPHGNVTKRIESSDGYITKWEEYDYTYLP